MLDPGGLVVLVVLLDKDGEGVRGLGCGGGGSSLGLGGHLLAVDHQLEPGRGTCAQQNCGREDASPAMTVTANFSIGIQALAVAACKTIITLRHQELICTFSCAYVSHARYLI